MLHCVPVACDIKLKILTWISSEIGILPPAEMFANG
jgi:hypothetical protein